MIIRKLNIQMNRNYTNTVKFVCCILIFFHHFYLGNSFVAPLGYLACAIFFFLSAWGVSKSLDKKELTLWLFIKRRLAKVYIPLLLVNFISISAAKIVITNWMSIPIFSFYCDAIQQESVCVFSRTLLYLLDVFQIDKVTWFVHILALVYLFVWAVHKIDSKQKYATVVVATFIAVEFVLWCIKAAPWYMVDIVGVPLGLLIYKFEDLAYVVSLRRFLAVGSIFLLVGSLVLFSMHTVEYSWGLLTGFAYSAACVMLVWLIDVRVALNASMMGTLGRMSYYVYLCHVKIASLITSVLGDKNLILSLFATFAISWFLMKLEEKIFHHR